MPPFIVSIPLPFSQYVMIYQTSTSAVNISLVEPWYTIWYLSMSRMHLQMICAQPTHLRVHLRKISIVSYVAAASSLCSDSSEAGSGCFRRQSASPCSNVCSSNSCCMRQNVTPVYCFSKKMWFGHRSFGLTQPLHLAVTTLIVKE
jgi:hypothetical protein